MPEEMTSSEVRSKLVEALRLDLVGPGVNLGDAYEVLPQAPSRWYLTGFLVPLGAKPEQRADEEANDDFDNAGEAGGTDDDAADDKPAARPWYFPSSIGASVLVPPARRANSIISSRSCLLRSLYPCSLRFGAPLASFQE